MEDRDERGWGGSHRDRWGARTEGVRDDWDYRDPGGYREPERSSPPQRYVGPSWTREPGYGGEGWERSDERIREDVCDRLAQHGYVDASDIDVRVSDCEVTLEGSVRERQEKRIAEDVAERVAGVRDVHNLLRVNREGPRREGGEQPGRPSRAALAGD